MSLKYLVTGASGQLGQRVIDTLLKTEAPETIGALIRRPEVAAQLTALGVQTRIASYDDAVALATAFDGVERLLLISSSEVGQRLPQHENVITAAKTASVGFLAYTSLLRADSSPLKLLAGEHAATEAALAASGLHYAVLRNGWYTENYAMAAPSALQLGAVYGAAGDGNVSGASRQDYAEAAVAVLTGTLPTSGTIFELAGDTAFTLTEFAAELSAQTGKDIRYTNLPEAAYASALKDAGLPEGLADVLADSDTGAGQGGLYDDTKTLSQLIKRPTTPWQETLKTFTS